MHRRARSRPVHRRARQPSAHRRRYGRHDRAPGVNAYAVLALPLAVCIPVAGVTLGHVARHQIRATGERGAGLALAALLIGYGISVLWLVLIAAAILA